MIEFKKNVQKVLPYDRQQYIEFLSNDFDSSTIKWYGVSFQLSGLDKRKEIGLTEFVEKYECWFKNTISRFDNNSLWIINHDDKDLSWFPNDDDNLNHLRTLFKKRSVPNTFRGALTFTQDDLLEFSKDLISYPYVVLSNDGFLYKDLDISHGQLQFVIKISGHFNIDFLSVDKELLREVVNENSSNSFILKEYKGTSL